MLKLLSIITALTVSACAYGVETELPKEDSVPVPTKQIKSEKVAQETVKNCSVVAIDEVSYCTVYTLDCDDGSREYAVLCTVQPVGYITNPPRPVSYGNTAKGKSFD